MKFKTLQTKIKTPFVILHCKHTKYFAMELIGFMKQYMTINLSSSALLTAPRCKMMKI